MRKTLIAVLVPVLALILAPAAQAHHVDFNKSSAACVLEGNVPTLKVDVVYVDFEEYNKPVSWSISINGAADSSGLDTWPASENPHTHHWSKSGVTANTSYHITYSAHWGRGYTVSLPFDTVVCPQPVPPPVQYGCDGKPIPPGGTAPVCAPPPPPPPPAPPVDCKGKPLPPGATPPTCAPKAPCVPYPKSRFRFDITPDMSTITHGRVKFQVRGPHIHWVRFHVDHRWALTDRSRPFATHVWLWQENVWGKMPQPLWGTHTVWVKIRTKCGTVTIKKKVFNHDPLPEGGTLKARTSRSSWSQPRN